VRQNLTFAFGVIALLIVASFLGLPLWLGVLGHEGSTLIVVLNGLRLLGDRPGELFDSSTSDERFKKPAPLNR
jgi:Cd2+/Zn2+-exporting ATPase